MLYHTTYTLDPYYKCYKLIENRDFYHINSFIEISNFMYLQYIAMYRKIQSMKLQYGFHCQHPTLH